MKFLQWFTAPLLAAVIWLLLSGHDTSAGWIIAGIWALWIVVGLGMVVMKLAGLAKGAAQRAAAVKSRGGISDDE